MSEQSAPARGPAVVTEHEGSRKSDQDALELRITELTGVAEYLSQRIAISQSHAERLEKEVEDYRRLRLQAEAELKAQEELNASKRRELHVLETEIKKNESTISNYEERVRNLAETVEISERRSKETIAAFQADTEDKLKAMKHEIDSEKERLSIELATHRNQTQAEMKQLIDELDQNRKKSIRALEIELQDTRKKAEEAVAKLLQDGRNKNEALIKSTEATALEVHRESEAAAKRLVAEANQKAADIIRTAQHEAEEVRRRTHNAEVSFLKEKNNGLAEMKLMIAHAKEEAQNIIAAATKEASEIHYKVEKENEAKIIAANSKISVARNAAEKETQDYIEKARAELYRHAKEQEAGLARKYKANEEQFAAERKRIEDEARSILTSARERAQAIIETANNERNFKFEELKAMENSMFQAARHSAAAITLDAEKIALNIVEEARGRAKTVEKSVENIIAQASDDATKIRSKAEAYAEKIKRDLPDPAVWDSELARIRQQEQDRLQSLIEPTVRNYLKAIDMAIHSIFMALPSKYQNNKVIQDFAEAIGNIQHKKNMIRFGDLIPRTGTPTQISDSSHPPLKKTS